MSSTEQVEQPQTQAHSVGAVAIGAAASAKGNYAIALGDDAAAEGDYAVNVTCSEIPKSILPTLQALTEAGWQQLHRNLEKTKAAHAEKDSQVGVDACNNLVEWLADARKVVAEMPLPEPVATESVAAESVATESVATESVAADQ